MQARDRLFSHSRCKHASYLSGKRLDNFLHCLIVTSRSNSINDKRRALVALLQLPDNIFFKNCEYVITYRSGRLGLKKKVVVKLTKTLVRFESTNVDCTHQKFAVTEDKDNISLGAGVSGVVFKSLSTIHLSREHHISVNEKVNLRAIKFFNDPGFAKHESKVMRIFPNHFHAKYPSDQLHPIKKVNISAIPLKMFEGGTLLDLLNNKDIHWTEDLLRSLVREVFMQIKLFHDKHIVHGDIKPENFMVAFDGRKFTVNIIDTGLSKNMVSKKLEGPHWSAIGTSLYMAPEVWPLPTTRKVIASHISSAIDIFSAGRLLFEMCGEIGTIDRLFPATTEAGDNYVAVPISVGYMPRFDEVEFTRCSFSFETKLAMYALMKKMMNYVSTQRPSIDGCLAELALQDNHANQLNMLLQPSATDLAELTTSATSALIGTSSFLSDGRVAESESAAAAAAAAASPIMRF